NFGPLDRFDMQHIILPTVFSSDTLVKIDFNTFGQGPKGVPFLTAVDVETTAAPDRPPIIDATRSVVAGQVDELSNVTGSTDIDSTSGYIAFTDPDLGDRPTAIVTKQTVTYRDAHGNDITAQLSTAQIATFESAFLPPVPESGNTNNGKVD